MPHVFFASYARLDNDKKRLRTVILDLRERVRSRLGARNAADVGFFDAEDGILAAADWEQTLGDAARQARVLVCFCSNTYFNSEYCANEFEIFRRRLTAVGTAETSFKVVLPVVWNPGAMPRAVSRYQEGATSQGFPDDYRQQGLLALRRNRTAKSLSTYNQTLDALTTVIETAYNKQALPPLLNPVVFAELPGVFDNPGPYGFQIGGVHPDGLRWELIPGRTLRFVAEKVAAAERRPWRALRVGDDIAAAMSKAAADSAGVILIADADQLGAGAWKVRAAAIDTADSAQVRILVGMRGAAGAALTPDVAAARVQAALPRLAGLGRAYPFDANDPAALEKLLAEQMALVRLSLVAADPSERVEDDTSNTLTNEALLEGITLATRPLVNGPEGSAT